MALLSAVVTGAVATSCASSKPDVAAEVGASQRGLASWYGADFAGLPTASGETFVPERISAAHRTLPLGTVVEVTNEQNGRTVRVRINDRGPFIAGRIVDLSKAAAAEIGSVVDGVVPVTLRVVGFTPRQAVPEEASSTTGWAVQAGAFASAENARRLKDRLAGRYPTPFVEEYAGLTRVKFGPYRSRGDAETARDSLSELGLAGIVVPYR